MGVWYGTIVPAIVFKRILKLQKRAARIILDADRTTPSITLFNTLNWLPFTRQSQIKRNTLVYKRVNTSVNAPNYIDRLLLRNSDIHQRETRYSNTNLVCPPRFTRKTEGGRTFTARYSIEWNSIDMDIRKKTSVASFKYNLYKSYLDKQKCHHDHESVTILKIF